MKNVRILLWVFIFYAMDTSGVTAHSGHSDEKALLGLEDVASHEMKEASSYAVGETESHEADLGLSRDGFMEETGTEPAMEGMTHDSGDHEDEHTGNQMPEIKLSEHEWVSISQKGYGLAVGITLLAGAIFGFMNFKRSS